MSFLAVGNVTSGDTGEGDSEGCSCAFLQSQDSTNIKIRSLRILQISVQSECPSGQPLKICWLHCCPFQASQELERPVLPDTIWQQAKLFKSVCPLKHESPRLSPVISHFWPLSTKAWAMYNLAVGTHYVHQGGLLGKETAIYENQARTEAF